MPLRTVYDLVPILRRSMFLRRNRSGVVSVADLEGRAGSALLCRVGR